MAKLVHIKFPTKLYSNYKSFNFFIRLDHIIDNNKDKMIILDLRETLYLDTNLLAILSYIIEKSNAKKINVSLYSKNSTTAKTLRSMNDIFYQYSDNDNKTLYPRKIGIRYTNENESLLLDDLQQLHLKDYDIIKTLLSELIANIKMHTIYREGTFCGYCNRKKNIVLFTIVNYDITIAKRLEQIRQMEFESDFDSIIWALKRTNTTRNDTESGGIGLYLLRKYIHKLNGKFIIISGSCYAEFDNRCYYPENENVIYCKQYKQMKKRYEGTIITLEIPFISEVELEPLSILAAFDISTL